MKIKFQKISEEAIVPKYAHVGDAGMDIFSVEEVILTAGERQRIKTGIKIEIPDGYVGLVWDKSGVSFNGGIKTMAGVVDSEYRGEIMVVLINLGKDDYKIEEGQKIAQMLVQQVEYAEIEVVDHMNETTRGDGGFGSTGLR